MIRETASNIESTSDVLKLNDIWSHALYADRVELRHVAVQHANSTSLRREMWVESEGVWRRVGRVPARITDADFWREVREGLSK